MVMIPNPNSHILLPFAPLFT